MAAETLTRDATPCHSSRRVTARSASRGSAGPLGFPDTLLQRVRFTRARDRASVGKPRPPERRVARAKPDAALGQTRCVRTARLRVPARAAGSGNLDDLVAAVLGSHQAGLLDAKRRRLRWLA
jgi:hypothetical protein